MKIIKTKFSNLLIFQGKKNIDSRGHLVEIFKQNLIKNKLKFDYFTTSKKNVLRGMHFQLKKQQDKLITVIKGKIIDFSIDLRKNSKTFGKIFKKELSDKNCISLLVPKGFVRTHKGCHCRRGSYSTLKASVPALPRTPHVLDLLLFGVPPE